MSSGRIRSVLLVCSATALLAAPAAASAKPGYFVSSGGRTMEIGLQGSNGYRIEISKQGRDVSLLADNAPNFVIYTVPSRAREGDRIEARFPGRGRVSIRFRPQGEPRRWTPIFPGCRGGETVEQSGHFVGTIRFRGEQGYTSVQATRAPGKITTTQKEVCKRSTFEDRPEPEEERTEVFASSRSKGRAVAFDGHTTTLRGFSFTAFGGQVAERRRGMTIYRSAIVTGEESQLALGDTRPFPLSAFIAPPAPFSGSAEYRRVPGGDNVWTGSLAVSLPGLGRVALTGPRFSALICRHSGCHEPWIDGHSLPVSTGTTP